MRDTARQRKLRRRLGSGVATPSADVVGCVAATALVGEIGEAAVKNVAVVEAGFAGLQHQRRLGLETTFQGTPLVFLDRLAGELAVAVRAGKDAQAAVLQ